MADLEEDPLSVSFKDTVFLEQCGLSYENALEYFRLSQFFDKTSINQQLIMQTKYNQLGTATMDASSLRGIEYALHSWSNMPSLYIIHKYFRHTREKTELLAVYYIAEGTIYQSPDLFTLLSNRILTSLHHVQHAFSTVSQESRFQPARPYHWGYEEEMNAEDDWVKSSADKHRNKRDAMNVDVNEDDDGIVIEAGGLEEEDEDEGVDVDEIVNLGETRGTSGTGAERKESYMKFRPLSATNYDGARAAYEFSARVDGLIEKMRASGPSWSTGGGFGSAGSGSSGVEAGSGGGGSGEGTSGVVGTGLTLEELKAAAKAKMEARAAAIQAANAVAGFKRPEPVDGGGYRAMPSAASGGTKKKKRMMSSSSMSESVGTPEYSGPSTTGLVPVQSPFVIRGSQSNVSSPFVKKGSGSGSKKKA
ncbi:hypothetical protein BCR33DRAFT_719401 [Rhizoclosmatium globosum]|uniref:Mediator of RNA polymerase II transcription subunit 6 n=1 Tax=Rhizoclosmatium globosum TaxID=329046 RepID=A0A1Y2C0A5_9FUNG|nr:hypothetical protein BCR33DRAFT_719401 [Rhizoclosmatium globosum]|eukprot:ORY40406.1 hypothetical protein BCR33DRAFT_719401 [Rhizoclosmatium globosum]